MTKDYYIGLNLSHVNPSASLVRDGKLLVHIEEERLIRQKHAFSKFPIQAIKACLEYEKVTMNQVDAVCLGYDFDLFTLEVPIHYLKERFQYPEKDEGSLNWEIRNLNSKHPKKMVEYVTQSLNQGGFTNIPEIVWYRHHYCHAQTAFRGSGFDTSLIAIIDAVGETDCFTVWEGNKKTGIKELARIELPDSLGWIYRAFTLWAGLEAYEGEGMLMGLAPYGRPDEKLLRLMEDVIQWDNNDPTKYKVNPRFTYVGKRTKNKLITDHLIDVFGSPVEPGHEFTDYHKNVAFAIQDRVEKTIERVVTAHLRKTGHRNLCIAGGVALNCKANGYLWKKASENKLLDGFYVYPVSSDDGIGIGACMAHCESKGQNMEGFKTETVFLGPSFTNSEVEKAIKSFHLRSQFYNEKQYQSIARTLGVTDLSTTLIKDVLASADRKKIDQDVTQYLKRATQSKNIAKDAAELLNDGKIIAWFQGRMEVGPRSLGARSILADPSREESRDQANLKVKFRQSWRPFCPTVLDTQATKYFKNVIDSPFMIIAFDTIEEQAPRIPAVVHVDGTARLQVLKKEHNPRYYSLLENFHALSHTPVLLNTSMNIKGEPICCTPEDALNFFFATDIDALVIEDWLIVK